MSKLARFNIIVAIDCNNGIAKNGNIPWNNSDDMKFFKATTTGLKKRNTVIMGRYTYESIPEERRPLADRKNVVISKTMKQEEHPDIIVYPSLKEALAGLGSSQAQSEEYYVIGGEMIYNEAVNNFMYLCDKVIVTRFKENFNCDQFFPYDQIKDFPTASDPTRTRDYTRFVHLPNTDHDEWKYLDLLEKIKDKGEQKPDRTGVGTLSLFGESLEFDISKRIPFLTTKKLFYNGVIRELLFFLSGKTDTNILEKEGVKIWSGNTSNDFLKKRGLPYEQGDMGPGYGFQWRHWGAEYEGAEADYTDKGVDQIRLLIEGIRNDPHSRRHILSAWNVSDLDKMAVPPCHSFVQFYVSADRRHLDCQLTQRSADMFLGVPFNIASYSLLTYMIAHICALRPRKLRINFGDCHIYQNHIEQVTKQLKRTPMPFATLSFRNATRLQQIDDFNFDSFIIQNYESWPGIQAPMAV